MDADRLNRLHWNEAAPRHAESPYYPLKAVVEGQSTLTPDEMRLFGAYFEGEGLHAQCGFGLETISLTRIGASLTGIDFSSEMLKVARKCAAQADVSITFLHGNILSDWPSLAGRFDFVYVSHGSIRWISDLSRWSAQMIFFLKPGGRLLVYEVHPLVYRLVGIQNETYYLSGRYCQTRGRSKLLESTHAAAGLDSSQVVHFDWGLGEIITALAVAGFSLELANELEACSYNRKNLLRASGPNLYLPPVDCPIPLSFALVARRPLSKETF